MSTFCALGESCERYDKAAKAPGLSYGYNLCDSCTDHCAADVAALVYDYVDLSQIIARRDGQTEVKIFRPKPASVPPIDLGVDTLRSAIMGELLTGELAVRSAVKLPARVNLHVRDGFNVQQAATVVAKHVDTLAGLASVPAWVDNTESSGVQVLTGLRSLHRRSRGAVGLLDLTIALPGYCPKCRAQALSRRDGSDTVHCSACSFAWSWLQYQRHVTLVVTQILPRNE